MRILVQRVFEAWVRVGGVEISRTKQGLLVLVGLTHDDNSDVADHIVSKILNMKLWEKDGKAWNGSVIDINGDVMVVSQFTLYGFLKGNKPDFHDSMEADKAKQLFNYIVDELKTKYSQERIQTGKFQTLMEVGTVINGPVTIQYEKAASEVQKKHKGTFKTKEQKEQDKLEDNEVGKEEKKEEKKDTKKDKKKVESKEQNKESKEKKEEKVEEKVKEKTQEKEKQTQVVKEEKTSENK